MYLANSPKHLDFSSRRKTLPSKSDKTLLDKKCDETPDDSKPEPTDLLNLLDQDCDVTAEDLEPVKRMVNDNSLANKDEEVIKIGKDSITRQDMTRFQGPHKPSHKSDGDLWLCDTNLTCLVNILNQEYHEVYQDIKQAVFFGKSFFYNKFMQVHHKNKNKANKFSYKDIVKQCMKAPGGSLLTVK